jgi:hypothetical protein
MILISTACSAKQVSFVILRKSVVLVLSLFGAMTVIVFPVHPVEVFAIHVISQTDISATRIIIMRLTN